MHQKAGRIYRVTRRRDVERIFADGVSARDRMVTLLAVPNGLPRARCGVAVSKRHGSAVQRNRIKRLCREAFRLSREQTPVGWDYMLIPRVGAKLALADLRASVSALAGRVARGERAAGKGQVT